MEKIGPVLKKSSNHDWHNQGHPHMQSKKIASQKSLIIYIIFIMITYITEVNIQKETIKIPIWCLTAALNFFMKSEDKKLRTMWMILHVHVLVWLYF